MSDFERELRRVRQEREDAERRQLEEKNRVRKEEERKWEEAKRLRKDFLGKIVLPIKSSVEDGLKSMARQQWGGSLFGSSKFEFRFHMELHPIVPYGRYRTVEEEMDLFVHARELATWEVESASHSESFGVSMYSDDMEVGYFSSRAGRTESTSKAELREHLIVLFSMGPSHIIPQATNDHGGY